MEIKDFENNTELQYILKHAKDVLASKHFSDIEDDSGNQYIDLVMEGGGMLGIALVGYVYVLEHAGIRFLGIGGTSAGSITALLLAAFGAPDTAKGNKLLAALVNKNFYDFVDGDSDVKDFIQTILSGNRGVKAVFKAAQVIDNIHEDWGLNPGDAFVDWISELLKTEGISTVSDLNKLMGAVPKGLRINKRNGLTPKAITNAKDMDARLAIIAADVSTESKIEFPKMAKLYWDNPQSVNPAHFVRASMSIPYFFKPYVINNIPKGPIAEKNWYDEVRFKTDEEGGVPTNAVFIDGGIMSNFPIDVFHDPLKVPDAPTFGVKLELDKRRKEIDGPLNLFGAMFNSARHTLDYDFITKNPDYSHLVKHIPAKEYNWLDFNMSDEKKLGLFLEGARCAKDFLTDFNWIDYKKLREAVAQQNITNLAIRKSRDQD